MELFEIPVWEKEEIHDVPLTRDEYDIFCHGYQPDWNCRYEPLSLGDGWHYIYRSGYLLKKFRYQLCNDGLYHLKEHYSTYKEKGRNLLQQILVEGCFKPALDNVINRIMKDRSSQ